MEKKIFDIDPDRCVGCYACVVACMDQNDLIPDDPALIWRSVYSSVENGKTRYSSIACLHCDDAPCVAACPTGAVFKDEKTCLVGSDKSKCIGCKNCAKSCPFGAPKFDRDGKMEKCTGCTIRVKNGLIPACVRVCPTKAIKYAVCGP